MNQPKKHHFFAQFHLSAWAGKDGRIPTYQRVQDGTIKLLQLLPENTGFETRLYTLEDVPEEERQKIEDEFFARHVDNHGAQVYQKIIAQEQLTSDERARWVRYLMAQRARTPDMVKRVKGMVDQGIRELCEEHKELYAIARANSAEELPESVLDWFDQEFPGQRKNLGLEILMNAIQNEKVSQQIFDMHWWVHDFKDSRVSLIASDRPLRITKDIGDPNGYITLPLIPSKLFVATPTVEKKAQFQQMDQLELVVRHNKLMVAYADRCVYGQTELPFVERHWGLGDKIAE